MKRLSSLLLSGLLVVAALLGVLLVAQPRVEAAPRPSRPSPRPAAAGAGGVELDRVTMYTGGLYASRPIRLRFRTQPVACT